MVVWDQHYYGALLLIQIHIVSSVIATCTIIESRILNAMSHCKDGTPVVASYGCICCLSLYPLFELLRHTMNRVCNSGHGNNAQGHVLGMHSLILTYYYTH